MIQLHLDRQSRVIIASYTIFCVGLLITSLFVVQQIRLVMGTAEKLYEHPFMVNNAALEAQVTAMTMRRDLLYSLLSRNPEQARHALPRMVAQDAAFDKYLRRVHSLYLGDMAEVERVEQLFNTWKPVRDAIMDLAQRGRYDQAQQLAFSRGTPIYEDINAGLNKIIVHSRDHAIEYLQEGQAQRGRAERYIILIMLGGFAASFLCSAIVIRHVRKVVQGHEQAIEHMAHFDQLTNLPNRQLFFDRCAQALRQAERAKEQVAILYVDLDRFKVINDTYGHEAGDQILTHVANVLLGSVRRSDTVARLGGDEFAMLLHDAKNTETLCDVAAKIVQAASTPIAFRGHQLQVGASMGIALYPADGSDSETLLAHADEAMYRAKGAGRNQCCFYADIRKGGTATEKDSLTAA